MSEISTGASPETLGAAAGRSRPILARVFPKFWEESSYLREYLGKYRKFVLIGLLTLVIVDVLEVLPPILLKQAVDVTVDGAGGSRLWWLAGAYFGISVLQGFCRYGWRMYLIRASLLSGRDLRGRFADHLFHLSASFFDRRPIGELMSHNTSDVEAVRMMIGSGLLTLADSLFYFIAVPIAMFWLSPKLALLAFLPLPVIPWLVMRNERLVHERYEKVQESFSQLSSMTQEALNGVRVTKGFAKEDALADRFAAAGREFVARNLRLARVQSSFGPTLELAMSVGLVALLYVAGGGIIREGDAFVTIGTFVAFQRYIQKMVWPMAALGMSLSSYQRSVTSSKRLKEVFSSSTDVPEVSAPRLPESFRPALAAGWKTAGRVELRNLTFSYPGTDRAVLDGISLTIEPGERVAFVGAIGAGKTALLSLLPRLYPVNRDMLLIDGVDVNDWPLVELRRQVGYVSQEVFLFSDSVIENVAYGLHEWREGTEHHPYVNEAAELACVHEDVLGLTEKYQTRVGERGVNLSGGQKQRLTIARAIIKQPSILVLDDALSSVDVQTEERILRGLRARSGRNTELIAAHRISTIRDADRIVLLEGGRVRQQGTHRELMADRRGSYVKFYEQQQMREDLEAYSARLETQSEVPTP